VRNIGKQPEVGPAPTLKQGGQKAGPKQKDQPTTHHQNPHRQPACSISVTWQIGRCYWIQYKAPSPNTDSPNTFKAGEIFSISQHKTSWRWLESNSMTTRSNKNLSSNHTILITDNELLHLHAAPYLSQDIVKDRILLGTFSISQPNPPLHSIGIIPLSLNGFWDTLNTPKWNATLLWLDRDLIPEHSSSANPTLWLHKVQPEHNF